MNLDNILQGSILSLIADSSWLIEKNTQNNKKDWIWHEVAVGNLEILMR
jgi:hypothetical protein